jgi:hypothetical protein
MTYAREGYRFYSVITPSVAKEYELPERDEDMTAADERKYRRLETLAEKHGTHIQSSTYALL